MSAFDSRRLHGNYALLLAGAALLVFAVDLILARKPGKVVGYLTTASLVGVFVASFFMEDTIRGEAFSGAYLCTASTLSFKRLFLVAGILASLGSIDYIAKHQHFRQGEYYLLLLCSLLGMTLLPGARDVLLLIVCFELMGMLGHRGPHRVHLQPGRATWPTPMPASICRGS